MLSAAQPSPRAAAFGGRVVRRREIRGQRGSACWAGCVRRLVERGARARRGHSGVDSRR